MPQTTVQTERATAELLGVSAQEAAAAVAALAEHELLGHGVLFLAVLSATRAGDEPVDAVRRFARGDAPPTSWSDYEARAVSAEARDEAARLRPGGPGASASPRPSPDAGADDLDTPIETPIDTPIDTSGVWLSPFD